MKRLLPAILALVFLATLQRQEGARAGAGGQSPALAPGSYAVNVADGALTPLGGPESIAVLSPDGALAAVVAHAAPGAGIRVVDLATGDVSVPLVSDQGFFSDPVWSPDGQWLAFRFERAGRPDPTAVPADGLYIVAPRTRETVAVLRDPPVIWTWGPDAGSITGVSFTIGEAGDRMSIAIIDVASGAATGTVLDGSTSICPTALAWSADGRRLVFQSGAFRQGCGDAESLGLWLWDADSGALRQLTHGAFYYGVAWAADGRILSRRVGGFDQATRSFRPDAIVLVGVDGAEQVLAMTPATPFPFVPYQETTERTVMYWQPGCEEGAVFTVDLAGGTPRRFSEPGAIVVFPRLAPDGASVAWVDVGADGGVLRLAASDGSGVHMLTEVAPGMVLTGWSGDGRLLSFTAGTPAFACPD